MCIRDRSHYHTYSADGIPGEKIDQLTGFTKTQMGKLQAFAKQAVFPQEMCIRDRLTMILPKADIVPKETTGGLDSVAVRFPSDPIAQELILAAGGYVAAPSANTSGRPSPTTAGHVAEDLGEAIDMIIDGGQVNIGLESTIVDFTEDIPVVLRPGYISLEMLRETLGDVRMDKGLIKPDSKVHPKAPGMKYRHYRCV